MPGLELVLARNSPGRSPDPIRNTVVTEHINTLGRGAVVATPPTDTPAVPAPATASVTPAARSATSGGRHPLSPVRGSRPHVVIVGGGFGGLKAARTLRHADVDITVVDRTNHHLFQPLLYQVATAVLAPSDITIPIRYVLRRQPNVDVLMADVKGIDVDRRVVFLDEERRELAYDYLILAAGARHSYFGHDDWETDAPAARMR